MEKEKKEGIKITKEGVQITFVPDFENIQLDVERIYSNFLSVTHDPFAFILTFCEAHIESIKEEDLKKKDEEGAYIVKAPIVSQIIAPIPLMPKIIEALQINYDKYLKDVKKDKKEELKKQNE